jgi:hypothetical protein
MIHRDLLRLAEASQDLREDLLVQDVLRKE